MEDSRIVDLYWQRDEGAISATAEKYSKYCNHIAYNILYSSEDAEECVNDTYLRAWNAIPPHRPVQLSTFLGKITRNLALNKYKGYNAKKRGGGQTAAALAELEECVASRCLVEDFIDESVLTGVINDFLRGLPKVNRVIFVKRYWYMTPVKEIAAEMSMRENRVATMLFRMRKELKDCLEKEDIPL
ncbi:RNA polymerase sigma factor [Ihubacter sp. rT4E-8]|uniref:RNA polymerase sigma factor n=1 Tax=unclassified Ihubacter TaxID=2633299 RepID=UPI00137B3D45